MRYEKKKVDEGPYLSDHLSQELTIVSLSGEIPGPERRTVRDQQRTGQLRTAEIFTRQGQGVCLIHMISAGGLLIESRLPIVSGGDVSIALRPGHRIAGQIVWIDDRFAGIRFAEWLDVLKLLGKDTLEGFPARAPDGKPAPKPMPKPALLRRLSEAVNRLA